MIWIAIVVCVVGLIIGIAHYKHTCGYAENTLEIFAVTIIIAFALVLTSCIIDGVSLDSKNIDFDTAYESSIKKLDVSININGEAKDYTVTYEDGNTKTIEPSKNTTIIFENVNKNSRSSNLENYKHVKVSKKEVFSLSTFATVTFTQYSFS